MAALQDPRVSELLGLPPDQLLLEMRVVTSDDELYGGAAAIVYLAKQIWWAWPFYVIAQFPGGRSILWLSYRWFADHRNCSSGKCSVAQKNYHSDLLKQGKGEPR
jgi:hypothetical protein